MTNRRELKFSPQSRGYISAFLVSLPFWAVIFFVIILLAPRGVPFIYSLLILFVLLSPVFIIWLYVLYKTLIPVTGGMPLKRFRQWVLLYPFIAGYGLFWALLGVFFDYSLPFLAREDREIFLPLLTLLCITLVLTLTGLRHRVARFLNSVFGTEDTEQPSDIPNV